MGNAMASADEKQGEIRGGFGHELGRIVRIRLLVLEEMTLECSVDLQYPSAGSIAIIKTVHLVANTDEQDITWSLAPLLW